MEMNIQEDLFFGDLLRKFRKRKRLNQKQLAEKIEVSRETVSLWERGEYKPDADRILYKLVDVLNLTAQEQQQLFEAYTVTALVTSFHNPPLERNPYFTGRGSQLSKLHTLLTVGKHVALTQAISGLGGIGKTQLALEYAYRYQKSYHDIFWMTADTYDSLMTTYVQCAAILELPEYDEQESEKVQAAVHHWLRTHRGWLIVLDNIEDLSLVRQFIPQNRRGAILLTTRRQVTEPVAEALELDLLPEDDAILFLLKRVKVLDVEMTLTDASDHDIAVARTITQLLGNLPLALDQAGAYILETQCGLAAYPDRFNKYRAELLRRRIGEGLPTGHAESVTTTFTLNFQQVQQRSEIAADVLRVCAYLSPENIGEEILLQSTSKYEPILRPLDSQELLLDQTVELLSRFSLMQYHAEEKTFSIHRLVQAVLQDTLDGEEKRTWAQRAILAVYAAFPHAEYESWLQCERLLTQALEVMQIIDRYQIISQEAGYLYEETASFLQDQGRYAEAEPLYLRALHIYEQVLGPDHHDVAFSLNGLALLYYELGKYGEAEPLFQRALRIYEQHLGPEHLDVTHPLYNLACHYADLGKYIEAETFNRRVLSIREKHLDSEHLDLAFPLDGLAHSLVDQGRYAEAEPLYLRALRIREQHLGPDHPGVAASLNGLAHLYQKQGKYAEAEPLFQQALRIQEQRLGPDHSDVAASLNGLAHFYKEQGKYAEAESLYLRALHIREQRLGPEHPDTAEVLHNLASFQKAQGNLPIAYSLCLRALVIREKTLGQNHPRVKETQYCLHAISQELSQFKEAASLHAIPSGADRIDGESKQQ